MASKVIVLRADPQDADRWEMSEFSSADEACAVVESLVTSGVRPESLRVLSGNEMAISVSLTPVVEISPRQDWLRTESRPEVEPQTDGRLESTELIPGEKRTTDFTERRDQAVRFRSTDAAEQRDQVIRFRSTDAAEHGDQVIRFRSTDVVVHRGPPVPFSHLFRPLSEGLVGVDRRQVANAASTSAVSASVETAGLK